MWDGKGLIEQGEEGYSSVGLNDADQRLLLQAGCVPFHRTPCKIDSVLITTSAGMRPVVPRRMLPYLAALITLCLSKCFASINYFYLTSSKPAKSLAPAFFINHELARLIPPW